MFNTSLSLKVLKKNYTSKKFAVLKSNVQFPSTDTIDSLPFQTIF